jgi:hypothetical protein
LIAASNHDLDLVPRLPVSQLLGQIFESLYFRSAEFNDDVALAQTRQGCRAAIGDSGQPDALLGSTEIRDTAQIGAVASSLLLLAAWRAGR